MNNSSNTLFHFTKKIDNVIGILKDGFKPNYRKENLNLILKKDDNRDSPLNIYFPMVCFCDIPLSQAKNHMKNYGNYGIGLSKDWGIEKKISPVLYAHNNSEILSYAAQLYDQVDNKNQETHTYIHGIFSMTKPYKETLRKNGKEIRFYDEREWRFVPNNPKIMAEETFRNARMRNRYYVSPLEFDPTNIKYIIIDKDDDRNLIIRELKHNEKYKDDIESLISKIISAKMIEEDF